MPSVNDNFADAIEVVIATNGGTYTSPSIANTGNTTEAGEPAVSASADLSMWFKYTPASTSTATLDTMLSTPITNTDSYMAVWTGTALGNLVNVASNDDGGGQAGGATASSRIAGMSVTAGTTYWVQIGGFGLAQMNVVLRVVGPASATAPGPAFDPASFDSTAFWAIAVSGIPSGTGSGTTTFTGSAVGQRTPKASGAGTTTFSGAATGRRTPKATGSGTTTYTGTAVGVAPPNRGTGSGTTTYTGTAVGKRTPKATGAGTTTFTASASGTTVRRGTGSGSTSYTGTAVGKRTPKGTGSGTTTFTAAATGRRSPKATGTGSTTYTGAAIGSAPQPGISEGFGSGSTTYTGTAVGRRTPKASGTGTTTYAGLAVGTTQRSGVSTGTTTYTGSAQGLRQPVGTGVGITTWTGFAVGSGLDGRDIVVVSVSVRPQRSVSVTERSAATPISHRQRPVVIQERT